MTDSSPRTEPILIADTLAGRYRITERIGRGGRAVVYAAHDLLLGREVAVKIFRAAASAPADVQLQEAEARLLGSMNHYALTTLFDAGVDTTDSARPRIYLVMERIPGLDLRRRLEERGPLTPTQVAFLGFDLAEGLQYVHEHGFLHRDIKPANVLLADRRLDSRIRGKLTDFGIATLIGLPDRGEFTTGTAAYLAPEQVEGLDATVSSDIYSLGLVLLEALTGRVAFPGSVRESAFARLARDPEIPQQIPPALADPLRSMTSLLPEERPGLTEIATGFQKAWVQELVDAGRVAPTLLPEDEDQRLGAVRRYNILDTPPDEAFDRITHLATRMLGIPIALATIVDGDREWFKSKQGIDLTEIDRDVALCATTVLDGRPFRIEDVRADGRFAANPVVAADPTLGGFVSVPMKTRDGHVIGTLCVFAVGARWFTDEEIADLEELAAMAMRELDFRLASRRAVFGD